MRTATLLFLLIYLFISGCNHQAEIKEADQTVNAVLGDISFIEKYGSEPEKSISEQTRIITHLEYVEQLLRQKDVSHLSAELRENRMKMIDLLNDYRTAGEFPKNYDHPGERKPCFIDRDGTSALWDTLWNKQQDLRLQKRLIRFSSTTTSQK